MLKSSVGNLVPIDLEIEATCRRNRAERRRNFLQDIEAATILEEPQPSSKLLAKQLKTLTETLSKLPTQLHVSQPSPSSVLQVAGCTLCGGAHESGCCIPTEESTHEVNYMGNQSRQNFYAGGFSGFQQGQHYNQQQNQWRIHPGNQLNKDQGGPSNRAPQQGPNLYERTTKLEETLAQFMQVLMSNHKSTELAIKNLEIQVGQLAKQIADNSSSKFGANTENNPKEECKAVMTHGKMATMAEEEKDEKIVDGDNQQLVTEQASKPEDNFCELEEIEDEEDDQENENTISKNENEINDEKKKEKEKEKEKEEEKEKENNEKIEKNEKRDEKKKSPSLTTILTNSPLMTPGTATLTTLLVGTSFQKGMTELVIRNWHRTLTNLMEGSIDVALMKEFYANLYVPGDKPPKQVRVRGHLIKFDADSLNTFLETPVVLEPGRLFLLTPGSSVLSYFNLAPTSHTSDLNLDRARLVYGLVMKMDMNVRALIFGQITLMAQSNSSRLGFLALIISFCMAQGVTSDSLTFESLSPAINLAYIKKNCWKLDDPTVSFHQVCLSIRSEHRPHDGDVVEHSPGSILGDVDLAQHQPIMSMEEFSLQVAWLGVQPSSHGRGEASVAQEPQLDPKTTPAAQEDDLEATPQSHLYQKLI
ncbi:hypothetical protein HKD37_01G000884 [Glycine soja]